MADLLTTVSAAIDGAIAGKSQATAGPLFTTEDHDTGTYVRNPDNWLTLAGVDVTGFGVWSSATGAMYRHACISAHHMIGAWHVSQQTLPFTERFVLADNTVITATVTAVVKVGTDVAILKVTEDLVAAGVAIMKFMPAGWNEYLLNYSAPRLPVVATIGGGDTIDNGAAYLHPNQIAAIREIEIPLAAPTNAKRLEFYWDKYESGDSSNFVCALVGTDLAAIGIINGGGDGGYGDNLSSRITAINAAMATQGPGAETVTVVDLSAFTKPYDAYTYFQGRDLETAGNFKHYNSVMQSTGSASAVVPSASDTVYLLAGVNLPIGGDDDNATTGTLLARLNVAGTVWGGHFTDASAVSGGVIVTGSFRDLDIVYGATIGGAITVTGRLSLDGGTTWLHPTSALAPASSVLASATNAGTQGTLPLAKVMASAGGNIQPISVRKTTADGLAAGGTYPTDPEVATEATFTMQAVSVPVAEVGQTTAYCYCYKPDGSPDAGVTITTRCVSTTSANAYSDLPIVATSGSDGLASWFVPRNELLGFVSTRGKGDPVNWQGVDAASKNLSELLG